MASGAARPSSLVERVERAWQAPLTLDQYHRMIDARVFTARDEVEFLEGFIVAMSPQGKPHYYAINSLLRAWRAHLDAAYDLRIQAPLTLARSEPEPDLAIVAADATERAPRHPSTAFLVVEVASDSLPKDRDIKAPLFAEAGVAEYWIIDVDARSVEVLTRPDRRQRRYRDRKSVRPGAVLRPGAVALPGVAVASLFPPAGRARRAPR